MKNKLMWWIPVTMTILWLGLIFSIALFSNWSSQAQDQDKFIRINEKGRFATFKVQYDDNYRAWVIQGEPAVFIYNFKTGEGFKVYINELMGTVKK